MNKASFLTLVRQASRISDQDVEELEKLVVNFPYCQTAHLLIAKAAYDKGSMLSNQKLKKAAIYAANRQLLKKLIYTSDATVSLNPLEKPETVVESAEKVNYSPAQTVIAPSLPEIEILEETGAHEVDLDADVTGIEQALQATTMAEEALSHPEASEDGNKPELPIENSEASQNQEETTGHLAQEPATEDAAIAQDILEEGRLPEFEADFGTDKVDSKPETEPESSLLTQGPVIIASELPVAAQTEQMEAEVVAEAETVAETKEKDDNVPENQEEEIQPVVETVAEPQNKVQEMVAKAAHTLEDVPDLHELFLENAPEAIKVPEEKEEEVKEQETDSATMLNDDLLQETLANFDQYLFRPEKDNDHDNAEEADDSAEELKVIYPENEIQQIYSKDPLGYWMSSSRLGESLQLKNDLTSPQPYDFYPELIWEYSKTHELRKEIKPAVSKLTKQLEIIDEFLKITPRLKTMAQNKIKPEAQEDLSSKSSKINKNLASENFANILVQQGKIKKAIKIYEHLILKIPEKKPYFVAQIEKLQNME